MSRPPIGRPGRSASRAAINVVRARDRFRLDQRGRAPVTLAASRWLGASLGEARQPREVDKRSAARRNRRGGDASSLSSSPLPWRPP